jgi:hypothetical protein
VYFNTGATSLFGYASDEIADLDSTDLFVDDINQIIKQADVTDGSRQDSLHVRLGCKHKDGHVFQCDASINTVDVLGQNGIAIALNSAAGNEPLSSTQSYQRLDAAEETLSSLLAFAKENPGAMPGMVNLGMLDTGDNEIDAQKSKLREQVVKVMNMSLSCWEHDLCKTKLELAEESGLWPVYIDKSTPTTRTLDKYLNIASCPKNPRSQRAVDTAEFVLRSVTGKSSGEKCSELNHELDAFRLLLSGIKSRK